MVSQLADWFTRSVQVPEIRSKLAAQGINPEATCGAQFSADMRRQYDAYGRAVREANIKAE
jgi:tripartite-type tricarboxylate transporter receptor subunit TctC